LRGFYSLCPTPERTQSHLDTSEAGSGSCDGIILGLSPGSHIVVATSKPETDPKKKSHSAVSYSSPYQPPTPEPADSLSQHQHSNSQDMGNDEDSTSLKSVPAQGCSEPISGRQRLSLDYPDYSGIPHQPPMLVDINVIEDSTFWEEFSCLFNNEFLTALPDEGMGDHMNDGSHPVSTHQPNNQYDSSPESGILIEEIIAPMAPLFGIEDVLKMNGHSSYNGWTAVASIDSEAHNANSAAFATQLWSPGK
jgi:hypothetical protein